MLWSVLTVFKVSLHVTGGDGDFGIVAFQLTVVLRWNPPVVKVSLRVTEGDEEFEIVAFQLTVVTFIGLPHVSVDDT